MPVPGVEGFYLGLAHPFLTPSHVLVLLALGLMSGGFEMRRLRAGLGVFLLSMAAGLIGFGGAFALHEALLATAVVAAVLAALAPARFPVPALGVVALGGVLLGVMALDPGPLQDQVTVAAGTFVGANLGLLFFATGVDWIREASPWPWTGIAVRIAAAWICAISLLLLALLFSANGAGG